MGLSQLPAEQRKRYKREAMEDAIVLYQMRGWTIADIMPGLMYPRKVLVEAIEAEEAAQAREGMQFKRTPAQAKEWDTVIVHGLRLPPKPRVDPSLIAAAYAAGRSLRAIAREFKLHHSTVADMLNRDGVTIRKVGKPVTPKTE